MYFELFEGLFEDLSSEGLLTTLSTPSILGIDGVLGVIATELFFFWSLFIFLAWIFPVTTVATVVNEEETTPCAFSSTMT